MTEAEQREEIGRRIKEARSYVALSQEEVALVLAIPRSAVSQIENGARGLDVTELSKLSELLGRSVAYLTGGAEATKSETVSLLARAAEGLSDDDIGELQRFAVFLQSRSKAAAG